MDLRFRVPAKACLLSAVTGLAIGPGSLFGQTDSAVPTAPARPTESTRRFPEALHPPLKPTPQTKQTDGEAQGAARVSGKIQQAADSYVAPAQQPSAVQQELEELYRRDGRTMPPMTFPGAPAAGSSSVPGTPRDFQSHQYNTSRLQAPPTPGPYQQGGYPGTHVEQKPSLLKRMFSKFRNPFKKSSEPPHQVVVPPNGQPSRQGYPPQSYPQPGQPQGSRQPQGYTQTQPLSPQQQRQPQPTFRQPNPYAGAAPQTAAGPALAAPGAGGLAGTPSTLRPETPTEKKELLPFTETPADAKVDDLGLALQQSEKQEQSLGNEKPATAEAQPSEQLPAFGQESESKSPPASPFSGLVLTPNESERAVPRLTPEYVDEDEEELEEDNDDDVQIADDAAPQAPGLQLGEQPPATPANRPSSRNQQLQLIAARGNLKGMKGFCPVELKNNRKLVNASPLFQSDYLSKTYSFSSAEAKAEFDSSPERFAPAYAGNDIVRLASGEVDVEGSLDHAVWYRGQLFLFSSSDSRDTFSSSPGKFAPKE